MAALAADPPSLIFRDKDRRAADKAVVSVRNIGRQSCSVIVHHFESDTFSAVLGSSNARATSAKSISLAPGMVTQLAVRIKHEVIKNVKETLTLLAAESGFRLDIPMTALAPTPIINMPDTVHFGTVVADGRLSSQTITIENAGSIDGRFKLVRIGSNGQILPHTALIPIQFRPVSGVIPKQKGGVPGELKVTFELSTNQTINTYRENVALVVEGDDQRRSILVKASLRNHALRILASRTGQKEETKKLQRGHPQHLSEIDLGSAYYKTIRRSKVVLYNDGPNAVNFVMRVTGVDSWTYTPDGSRLEDDDGTLTPESIIADQMLEITPHQGTLKAYSDCIVTLHFRPSFGRPLQGWTRHNATPPRRDFSISLTSSVVGSDIKAELVASGTGLSPQFSIDRSSVFFNPCAVGKTSVKSVYIRNHNDQLPLSVQIDPVAHFDVEPSRLLLLPEEEQELKIIFEPNQIGQLDTRLEMHVAKRSALTYLHLNAECIEDLRSTRRGRSFGLTASAKSIRSARKTRLNFGFTPAMHADISGTNGRQTAGINPTANPNIELPPVKPKATPIRGPDPQYNHDPETAHRLRESRNRSTSYVHQSAFTRAQRAQIVSQSDPLRRDDDGGIGYPPKLILRDLNPDDGLGKSARTSYRSTAAMINQSAPSSSSRTKKKFSKPRAKSATSKTDHELSPEELSKIELKGGYNIEFGDICMGSTNVTELVFYNGLDRQVSIEVLSTCQPETSVEPQGPVVAQPHSTVTLRVTVTNITDETSPRFSDTLTYAINGAYKSCVVIAASVVPPSLTLSTNSISVPIGCISRCPQRAAAVTLQNTLGHPIRFKWSLSESTQNQVADNSSLFQVSPGVGIVPPYRSLDCAVELSSEAGKDSLRGSTKFWLHVDGAEDVQPLECMTSLSGSKCIPQQRLMFFGEIGVNRTAVRSFTIDNVGDADAYFSVSKCVIRAGATKAMPAKSIEVTPAEGVIKAGCGLMFTIAYTPPSATKFDGSVTVSFAEGKPITIPFVGTCKESGISLNVKQLKFHTVVSGSSSRLPFSLANTGNSDVTACLDFSNDPAFRLLYAGDVKKGVEPTVLDIMDPNDAEGDVAESKQILSSVLKVFARHPVSHSISDVPSNSVVMPRPSQISPRGSLFKLELPAGKEIKLLLECRPLEVAGYDFDVPISVNGNPLQAKLRVLATAIRGPVNLKIPESCTGNLAADAEVASVLDFGSVYTDVDGVVQETVREFSVHWNGSVPGRLLWQQAWKSRSRYKNMASAFTLLDAYGKPLRESDVVEFSPGESRTLSVRFTPSSCGHFRTRFNVLVDGKENVVFRRLEVRGFASDPYLSFSKSAIHLPAAPLGVQRFAHFEVYFHGYSDADALLRLRQPADSILDVKLPKGCGADNGTGSRSLPVEIAFSSDSPICFAETLEFYDVFGRNFGVRVTGKSDASALTIFEESTLDELTEITARFLSSFGLAVPRSISIPASLVECYGKAIFDIVLYLAGEEVPGIKLVRPDIMTTAEMLDALGCLIRFVTSRGGMVNEVEPSSLLPGTEFGQWVADKHAEMLESGEAFRVTGAQWREDCIRRAENHNNLLRRKWTVVCLQIIRVFVIGRVTDSALEDAMLLESRRYISIDKKIMSPNEGRLLSWLNSVQPDGSGSIRNFGSDLADGTAIINAIAAAAPWIRCLHDTYKRPIDPNLQRHNACRIIEALGVLRATDSVVHWSDITRGNPVWMLLFVMYLFETLPDYQPKQNPIVFTGSMGATIRRSVTLSNPAKNPLIYQIMIHGSDNFECTDTAIRIPPKGSATVELLCIPSSYEPSKALLYLLSSGGASSARAGVLSFSLEAATTTAGGIPMARIEAPCYEMKEFFVKVKNPVDVAATFDVTVAEVPALQAKAMARADNSKFTHEPLGMQNVRSIAFAENNRRAMWPKEDTISLGPGASKTVHLYFCPTRLGHFRGAVVLSNAEHGEVEFVVTGYSRLPLPVADFNWQSVVCSPMVTDISVPYINDKRSRAMKLIPAAFSAKSARNTVIAKDAVTLFSERVLLKVDLLGNKKYTGSPFDAPKELTLDPAFPTRDGDLLATHLTRTSLVQIREHTELPVRFDAVSSGTYSITLVLTGPDDVRVYRVSAVAKSTASEMSDQEPKIALDRAENCRDADTGPDVAIACTCGNVDSFTILVPCDADEYQVLSDLPDFISGESQTVNAAAGPILYTVYLRPSLNDTGEYRGRFAFVTKTAAIVRTVAVTVKAN